MAYSGISTRAASSALQSDLKNASTHLELAKVETGSYPNDDINIPKSSGTNYEYTSNGTSYCLTATSGDSDELAFHISNTKPAPQTGTCEGHEGPSPEPEPDPEPTCADTGQHGTYPDCTTIIQTVTGANCPTERTRTVDVRDNRTYWVQKLADGKCWMLTNLAYAGGGTNTYGDVKTLINGTGDTFASYTARYFIHPDANVTSEPTNPSVSTDGGNTDPQFGYLYSWCASMGVQTSTSACVNATTPAPDIAISICPAGWRLPTGTPTTGEFTALNTAVNGGSTTTGVGLRSVWLAQRSGYWSFSPGFGNYGPPGGYSYYWSSSQSSEGHNAYQLSIQGGSVVVNTAQPAGKQNGFAVRCVAT